MQIKTARASNKADTPKNQNTTNFHLKQLSFRRAIKLKMKKKPYANKHPRKILDMKLIEMIALDFQPTSIVNDIDFIRYIHALNECYQNVI